MVGLERYAWPGNIRELQNVLERACVLSPGPVVEILDELNFPGRESASETPAAPQGAVVTLAEGERILIRQALASTAGRIHGADGAAALLDLKPSTLRSRMKKLGIAKPRG
jgi:DNA-binding NtrC family response regulator